ncbi:MAG: type II toxin-antitoxin system HicA family toxin [Candidatus Zambryskibacteria bacterium]|nr:type II toxin-antitoxin system HicA family toxin [Candidatus Zambryskibacteria bacterium]
MKWRTAKAPQVLRSLFKLGRFIKRQKGSHRILTKSGWPDFTFAFHEQEEIGPRMLARISKCTGLMPDDL